MVAPGTLAFYEDRPCLPAPVVDTVSNLQCLAKPLQREAVVALLQLAERVVQHVPRLVELPMALMVRLRECDRRYRVRARRRHDIGTRARAWRAPATPHHALRHRTSIVGSKRTDELTEGRGAGARRHRCKHRVRGGVEDPHLVEVL